MLFSNWVTVVSDWVLFLSDCIMFPSDRVTFLSNWVMFSVQVMSSMTWLCLSKKVFFSQCLGYVIQVLGYVIK